MTETSYERFVELLEDFDNAMLVTQATDGQLRSRPMRIADREDNCELLFVTSADSGKIEEITAAPRVNVSLQGSGKFLSLSGKAVIERDRGKIDELWNKAWEIWFPQGKDDPEITLIRVVPDEGEYWDMSGLNRLKFLFRAGKAWLAGEKLQPEDSDMHDKVKL